MTMLRTERAIIAACGVKLIEKRISLKLMDFLGLEETVDEPAKANGVRWYEYALTRDNDDVLRRALDFEVIGRRGRVRSKTTWI